MATASAFSCVMKNKACLKARSTQLQSLMGSNSPKFSSQWHHLLASLHIHERRHGRKVIQGQGFSIIIFEL